MKKLCIIIITGTIMLNSCVPPSYISLYNTQECHIFLRQFQKYWNKSKPIFLSKETLYNCFVQMQTVMPKGQRYAIVSSQYSFYFTDIYLDSKGLWEICEHIQQPLSKLRPNEFIHYNYNNYYGYALALLNKDIKKGKLLSNPDELIFMIAHYGGYLEGTKKDLANGVTMIRDPNLFFCYFDSNGNLLKWEEMGNGWSTK